MGVCNNTPVHICADTPEDSEPGGLGHADLDNKLMPTLVPRQLLGGARVGRCHGLREELAFAMGTHERLGAGSVVAGGGGGRRRSRRAQGKAPAAGREEEGCPYPMMPADLVNRVVEVCGWRTEGELGEGVVRLMRGLRTKDSSARRVEIRWRKLDS